jgi:hypothetical protein
MRIDCASHLLAAFVSLLVPNVRDMAIPTEAIDAWRNYEQQFTIAELTMTGEDVVGEKVESKFTFKTNGKCRLLITEKNKGGQWHGQVSGENVK